MTPSLRFLSYAVKMVLKNSTIVLGLCILTITPSLVLSLGSDASPLYKYIVGGVERFEHERTKRDLLSITEEDIENVLQYAEDTVKHLAYYENILSGRRLLSPEGSPSHTATLYNWGADEALPIAKLGFVLSKASYYLAYKFCLRNYVNQEKTPQVVPSETAWKIVYNITNIPLGTKIMDGKKSELCALNLAESFKNPVLVKTCLTSPYRTHNGSCNNEYHAMWGASFTPFSRLLPPTYKDGIWEPRGKDAKPLTSAAEISNTIVKHSDKSLAEVTLSLVSWASLVTYDMAHTVSYRMIHTGDPVMCCDGTSGRLAPRHRHPFCMPIINEQETKCYNYVRSMLAPNEDYRFGPAQQMNEVSHFLDGSSVYGNTERVANALRTRKNGQIRLNTAGGQQVLPSLFSSSTPLLFSEMRLNMDVMSTVLHIILAREHNRIATELARINGHWEDEKLYQEARRIVIAEIQHITYSEWLPVLLGEKEISSVGELKIKPGYSNLYNSAARPSVANSFANAAMRFVVSMVDEKLSLYDEDRNPSGNISLRFNLYNTPKILEEQQLVDSLVRSLSSQNCQANDLSLPLAVTKNLYSIDNETGLDVLSLDIQRGRDHGLPPYAAFRKYFGLKHETFEDLTSTIPKEIVADLKKAYGKVSYIDLIVGGLAEIPKKGSLLGPVFSGIISEQMINTRIGDRFFYDLKNQPYPFTPDQLNEIKNLTLARLFCDNTSVKKMQPHVFKKQSSGNQLVRCDDENQIKRLNLIYWKQES